MTRETFVRDAVLNQMSSEILDDVELQMVNGSIALSPALLAGCCVNPSCMGSYAAFATMGIEGE